MPNRKSNYDFVKFNIFSKFSVKPYNTFIYFRNGKEGSECSFFIVRDLLAEHWKEENTASLNKADAVQLAGTLEKRNSWRFTVKTQMGSMRAWFVLASSCEGVLTDFKKTVVGNVAYDSTKSVH